MNKMILGFAVMLLGASAQIAVAAEEQPTQDKNMESVEYAAMNSQGDFAWLDQDGVERVKQGQNSEYQVQDIAFRTVRRCHLTPRGRRCVVIHSWR